MSMLSESFTGPALAPGLAWLNEPPSWQLGADGLILQTAPKTDFWQGTHYGFRVDTGHVLQIEASGDFVLETEVRTNPMHQYDQAGLMIRISATDWLKTSVEYEPGAPSRLGAVITNHGWSDWSTQDVDPETARAAAFRMTRNASDYLVEARLGVGASWSQIRLGRLQNDGGPEIFAGLYACSPKAAGMTAVFRRLSLMPAAAA